MTLCRIVELFLKYIESNWVNLEFGGLRGELFEGFFSFFTIWKNSSVSQATLSLQWTATAFLLLISSLYLSTCLLFFSFTSNWRNWIEITQTNQKRVFRSTGYSHHDHTNENSPQPKVMSVKKEMKSVDTLHATNQ